jgi:hypothetical protein
MAAPLAERVTTTMRTVPPRRFPSGPAPAGDSPNGRDATARDAVAMRDLPAALSKLLGKREKTGPAASSA